MSAPQGDERTVTAAAAPPRWRLDVWYWYAVTLYATVLLASGLLRVSLVSLAYLVTFFPLLVLVRRGAPTASAYVAPAFLTLLSIMSIVAGVLSCSAAAPGAIPALVVALLGLVDRASPRAETALYFGVDVLVLIASIGALVVVARIRRAARDRAAAAAAHDSDSDTSSRGYVPPTCSSSSSTDSGDTVPSTDPERQGQGQEQEEEDGDCGVGDSGETKLLGGARQTRLTFVPRVSVARAAAAVLVAVCAGAFVPCVLALPYVLFVVAVCASLAQRSRRASRLAVQPWLTAVGAALCTYVFLHTVCVYAFQFTYTGDAGVSPARPTLGDLLSSSSLSSLSSSSSAVVAPSTARWLGLYFYHEFRAHWQAPVAYASALLLFVVLVPCFSCVEPVSAERARALRERTALAEWYRTRAAVAGSIVNSGTRARAGPSVARVLVARAVYPHGWKLCLLMLLCAAVAIPGMPSSALLVFVLVTSFMDAERATCTSRAMLALSVLWTLALYAVNIPLPGVQHLNARHGALMQDLSLPLQSARYQGLVFCIFLLGMLVLALFVRIRTAVLCTHREMVKAHPERTAPLSTQDATVCAVSATLFGQCYDIQDFSLDSTEPGTEADGGNGDETMLPTKANGGVAKEEEDAKWQKRVWNALKRGAGSCKQSLKYVMVHLLLKTLQYSYYLALVALYFTCLRGSNVINFIFMVFFLGFTASPSFGRRWWIVLVIYSDVVLLVRHLWLQQWLPDDTTVTLLIGLVDQKEVHSVEHVFWEAALVVFVTAQMYFLALAPGSTTEDDRKRDTVAMTSPLLEGREADDDDDDAHRHGHRRLHVTLQDLEERAASPFLDQLLRTVVFLAQKSSLFLCLLALVMVGVLLPISCISLGFLCAAYVVMLFLFVATSRSRALHRTWVLFLAVQAVVLFAEYAYQSEPVRTWLDSLYQGSAAARWISLRELGLVVVSSRKDSFVVLLPYMSIFVLCVVQYNIFGQQQQQTSESENATSGRRSRRDVHVPAWASAAWDFVARTVFVYCPFVVYVFAVVIFVREITVSHLLALLLLFCSRFHAKGIDWLGGAVMVLCQALSLCILAYNMEAFDAFAATHTQLCRWLGLPREYVPRPTTAAHTECLHMVYEYLVLIALVCVERISLRWGTAVAHRLGWCAAAPREMPLFRALDGFHARTAAERAQHPWQAALSLACRLPSLLTKQLFFCTLCVCFYLHANTALGVVYLAALIVAIHASERTLRRCSVPFAFCIALLTSAQYVFTLRVPRQLSDPDTTSSASSSFASSFSSTSLSSSLTSSEVLDSSTSSEFFYKWPWEWLKAETREWLLLWADYPLKLLADMVLLYFLTALVFQPRGAPDLLSVMRVSGADARDFPRPPRSTENWVRYALLRVLPVGMVLCLFLVGCSSSALVSLVYLVASLRLLYAGDFLMRDARPWRRLLLVCYGLISLQLLYQLAYTLEMEFGGARSERVMPTIRKVGLVLGLDYTPDGVAMPADTVLYAALLLFVLSLQHSLSRRLAPEFARMWLYHEDMRHHCEDKARRHHALGVSVRLRALEHIFAQKAERRARLNTLRESRKRKRTLFPELMAELDDAGSASGGSMLSAEEARLRRDPGDADDSDGTDAKGARTSLWQSVRGYLRCVPRACVAGVDWLIFALHGEEGLCHGSKFEGDLKMLKREIAEEAKHRNDHQKESDDDVVVDEEETKDEQCHDGMKLTAQALSVLSFTQCLLKHLHEDEETASATVTTTTTTTTTEDEESIEDLTLGTLAAQGTRQLFELPLESIIEPKSDATETKLLSELLKCDVVHGDTPLAKATLRELAQAVAKTPASECDMPLLLHTTTLGMLIAYNSELSSLVPPETADYIRGIATAEGEESGEEMGQKHKKARRSRFTLLMKGVWHFLRTSSEYLCLVTFLLNHLANGTLLSLVYVIFGFGYVALANRPHPQRPFWSVMMVFTSAVIVLKFVVQIPGVCMCHTLSEHWLWFSHTMILNRNSVMCDIAQCMLDSGSPATQFSIPYLLGLVPNMMYFGRTAAWDVVVLLAIVLHVTEMSNQGIWEKGMADAIAEGQQRFEHRLKQLREEEATKTPTLFEAKCDVEGRNKHYLSFKKGDVIRMILRGTDAGATSIGELNGVTALFDVSQTKPITDKKSAGDSGEDSDEDELGQKDELGLASTTTTTTTTTTTMKDEETLYEAPKEKKEKEEKKSWWRRRAAGLKRFYWHLVHDHTRLGKDYYTAMFVTEFLCFVYLLFFAATFTGSSGQLVEYVQQSYLPTSYVMVLLVQFVVILVDRIIYLCRSVFWKLVMQYGTLVVYNVFILWVFPYQMDAQVDFERWESAFCASGSLQVLFLFKCVYWLLSALQIRDGYPMVAGERVLMRSYDLLPYGLFMLYRTLPFVYDIRTILDWTFIPTTLMFWDYLKVEDIYAELYRVAATVLTLPKRRPGDDRALSEKCTMGCTMVTGMALILWLPLLLLSSSLPGMQGVKIEPVYAGTLAVGVANRAPLFTRTLTYADVHVPALDPAAVAYLRRTFAFVGRDTSELQMVTVSAAADTLWQMTPVAREELLAELDDAAVPLSLVATLTLYRRSAANSVVAFEQRLALNATTRHALASATRAGRGAAVNITGVLPRFVRMPGTTSTATSPCTDEGVLPILGGGNSSTERCTPVTFELTCHGHGADDLAHSYWSFCQVPETSPPDSIFTSNYATQLVLLNTPVSDSSTIFGKLAAYGLIGIYTTIVLAVANAVRSFTANWSHIVMFWNLPDPTRLLRLCQDIILARMDGDLLLEEELSNELLEIYRSPESLIENTRLIAPPSQGDDDDDDDDDDGDDDHDHDEKSSDEEEEEESSQLRHRK